MSAPKYSANRNDAYQEGFDAFYSGCRLSDNPYSTAEDAGVLWETGWLDADSATEGEEGY